MSRATLVTLLALMTATGCRLANEDLLNALADGGGATDAAVDAPVEMQLAVDQCGAADVTVLGRTTTDILIDTSAFPRNTQVQCGETMTPGADGFLAIDVQANEFWHFHLRTETGASDRNPVLYLLNESCNPRDCEQLSNSCTAANDEHFAFIAPAEGRWYIGIDDGNEGSGRYLLDAIKLDCGDGTTQHGEGCDGGELCTSECRRIMNEESRLEYFGFHDNFLEAFEVQLPAPDNQLEIQGDMGGAATCNYPDIYTLVVPDGFGLQVVANDESSTRCMTAATAPFSLDLLNAAGTGRGGGEDANGCPIIDETSVPPGRYFVRLTDERLDRGSVFNYRLFFRLVPS